MFLTNFISCDAVRLGGDRPVSGTFCKRNMRIQLIWRSDLVFRAVSFKRYKRRGDAVTWRRGDARRDNAIHLDRTRTKWAFERIVDVRVPNFYYDSQMQD